MNPIDLFFTPKSVAIIGASSNPNKLSFGILKNLTSYGYQGKVYPINPKAKEILNLTCYPSILAVPETVDLAVIVLPAQYILQVLKDCAEKGIRAVTIISGGFKEIGGDGASLELDLLKIARENSMRLIGPNCVGTVDLHSGLNTSFINGLPPKGSIAFISQSGAVLGGAVDYLLNKGIGFSHFVSLGNEADITETDMIEYFAGDPKVKAIMIYAESIQDGARFIEVTKKVTPRKPVILIKAGRSEAGARAVSSHTGSLAGSQAAYLAAYKQSGVIFADTLDELYSIASGFESQPLPAGPSVVIITNAGGPAALASDALEAQGMTLANLDQSTMDEIRKHVNPAAQVQNPIDMLGGASPEEYKTALEIALKDPNVDAVIPILVPQSLVNSGEVAEVFGKASQLSEKPMIACLMGKASLAKAFDLLKKYNVPAFPFPETCATVLGKMHQYTQIREQTSAAEVHLTGDQLKVNQILNKHTTHALGEFETRPILQAYDIPVIPAQFASTPDETLEIAEQIGYPLVMKIVSPNILHKSDSGGIALNLKNVDEVRTAYNNMFATMRKHQPDAVIDGVLIQKMASSGQEVIIGMKRDSNFGPLMMFGLGGIYVELFKDIAFRVAPMTQKDALEMIEETSAGKLLKGIRGNQPSDIDAVVDTLLKLSQLAIDHPQILEIEINPFLVHEIGKGAVALDARAILKEKG
ncbi:MAG: acetate--CoA ligase family protein [Anaerolineaceae bacterium]|nr:acetate--CoA ligase family protein [Anaerolineaceae bacterium]